MFSKFIIYFSYRLTQYSNAVGVISNAGVWVKNLKNMLQRDVEECKKKTEKILQQKQSVSLLMSRIQKLIAEKSHLEEICKLNRYPATLEDWF